MNRRSIKTFATEASPSASKRDKPETNDTNLQLFACCALSLLSGGACSWQSQGFSGLVHLSIAIRCVVAGRLADLLKDASVASDQSIDAACDA